MGEHMRYRLCVAEYKRTHPNYRIIHCSSLKSLILLALLVLLPTMINHTFADNGGWLGAPSAAVPTIIQKVDAINFNTGNVQAGLY